jgi:hypothetical protein
MHQSRDERRFADGDDFLAVNFEHIGPVMFWRALMSRAHGFRETSQLSAHSSRGAR